MKKTEAAGRSASLQRLAPAKVNLALHVVGQRADGYHLLETLVAFTRFGDHVSLSQAEETSITASGPFAAEVPLNASNLILHAHDLLTSAFPGRKLDPVLLSLEKNLPVASGIGGGSSDAAAAAILLARHWGLELTESDLAPLLLPLGADVPMCVAARPLIARGTGAELEYVTLPRLSIVLVNPGVPLATPPVFRALQKKDNAALPPMPGFANAKDVIGWLGETRNDLEAPAARLVPAIHDVLAELSGERASFARMSGSGATCFGIFLSDDDAGRAAKNITERHPSWFVAPTSTRASEEIVP